MHICVFRIHLHICTAVFIHHHHADVGGAFVSVTVAYKNKLDIGIAPKKELADKLAAKDKQESETSVGSDI